MRANSTTGALANGAGHLSTCTSTQVAPYLNGSKDLTFQNNHYHVPNTSARYWVWGYNTLKYWREWQAIPQDSTGTVGK